jgi:hypothetical protein
MFQVAQQQEVCKKKPVSLPECHLPVPSLNVVRVNWFLLSFLLVDILLFRVTILTKEHVWTQDLHETSQ